MSILYLYQKHDDSPIGILGLFADTILKAVFERMQSEDPKFKECFEAFEDAFLSD